MSFVCNAQFQITNFTAGGAVLVAALQGGSTISGSLTPYVQNVSGGVVPVTATFFSGIPNAGKLRIVGNPEVLNISAVLPATNSIKAPADATWVEITFSGGNFTLPVGYVSLTITNP